MTDDSGRRPRAEQPSHADIISRQDMAALVMQRIEGKLDDLTKTVGFHGHDERGDLIGTGIAGDLARLKKRVDDRFGVYDRWTQRLVGMASAIVVTSAAVWWLVKDRMAEMFR